MGKSAVCYTFSSNKRTAKDSAMSKVHIRRAVENISSSTNLYTPVIEMVVNAIQAIAEKNTDHGEVHVRVVRSHQLEAEGPPAIRGFVIEDNGIGFTSAHRDSFDTLYSDKKAAAGGKGFGRFSALKHFQDLRVQSCFAENGRLFRRCFSMGKEHEIIVEEDVFPVESGSTGSKIFLDNLKPSRAYDKDIFVIARNIAERILPYLISDKDQCPGIFVCEEDGSSNICLNHFLSNQLSADIVEIALSQPWFELGKAEKQHFSVRVFKIFNPGNQISRISLVAHQREVSTSPLHKWIPEFEDRFVEGARPYIIKAYVFGAYLDRHVLLERGGFDFPKDDNDIFSISQSDIERQAAKIAQEAAGASIVTRQKEKRQRIVDYVDAHAPWHKGIVSKLDMSSIPLNASHEDIESRLEREKIRIEHGIRKDVLQVLAQKDRHDARERAANLASRISETSLNDLAHYVALRRSLLDLFEKSLEKKDCEKHHTEGYVHDIIFPRKSDSDSIDFENHNLWIIDERLNFTSLVASDQEVNGKNSDRPDLLVFGKKVAFRGENEGENPVTVFEFKRPMRDDFANDSSREDPVEQIVRYVIDIRQGKYQTPQGRPMKISPSTPFYGYVVCDLTPKVTEWLSLQKNFTPMADGMGWFQHRENIRLHIEVLSWEKILKDAVMRNRIFFKKLGIH